MAAPASVLPRPSRLPWLAPGLATAAVILLAVVLLRAEGRLWWCACGEWTPWTADAHGPHNSQHFLDPYSLTHILHGLVLWGVLTWLRPRSSVPWRFTVATALEAAWEVVENTDFVIERYRAATLAVGYRGDTVANSVGDMFCCAVGLLLARRLGLRGSIALFLVIEAVLLVWIKDSLLLNVVMLLFPIESIRAWQMGR